MESGWEGGRGRGQWVWWVLCGLEGIHELSGILWEIREDGRHVVSLSLPGQLHRGLTASPWGARDPERTQWAAGGGGPGPGANGKWEVGRGLGGHTQAFIPTHEAPHCVCSLSPAPGNNASHMGAAVRQGWDRWALRAGAERPGPAPHPLPEEGFLGSPLAGGSGV